MNVLLKFLTSKLTTWFLVLLLPFAVVLILVSNRDFELADAARSAGLLIFVLSILLLFISIKVEGYYTQKKKSHLAFSLPCELPRRLYVIGWMPNMDINNSLVLEGEIVRTGVELSLTVVDSCFNGQIRDREIVEIQVSQCKIANKWYEDNQTNECGLSNCLFIFSSLQLGEVIGLLEGLNPEQSNFSLKFEKISDSTQVMKIDFGQIPFSVNETASVPEIEFSFESAIT